MKKLSRLMTLQEMRERFQKGDDPFGLTIEKWVRIRKFLDAVLTLNDFQELFRGAVVAVPFCFEFQVKDCFGCPLEEICSRGKREKFQRLIRLFQAYTLAGDMLPRERLTKEVDNFLIELEMIEQKSKGIIH